MSGFLVGMATCEVLWRHCIGMKGNQITRRYDAKESPRTGKLGETCDWNNGAHVLSVLH